MPNLEANLLKATKAMTSQGDCPSSKHAVCSPCFQGPWVSLSPAAYLKKLASSEIFDLPAKWTAYMCFAPQNIHFPTLTFKPLRINSTTYKFNLPVKIWDNTRTLLLFSATFLKTGSGLHIHHFHPFLC